MNNATESARTPRWIWAIMIALPAIMPLTFAWIAFFPPQGTVPTGIHGVDGAVFINCMRMFDTGFFTPYANCHALLGNHASQYFGAPFFWMYGILGALGRTLHANEFLLLGLANGIGGFLYLFAAYALLRTAFPKQANIAFALFALAGGPGGLLYIATWAMGLHDAPAFEQYFYRYALYQLFEGARPSPILAMPRLYYTVSMACCLGSVACILKSEAAPSRRCSIAACALLFTGTFVNLRYGPMTWAVILLYLAARNDIALANRIRTAAETLAPVALAWAAGWLMIRRSPAFFEGTTESIRTHMWLSPFLSAMLFHFFVVPQQVLTSIRALPRIARIAAYAAVGYLAAYGLLYILYNAYYGNFWLCLDVTSAVKISDVALAGAAAGAIFGAARRISPGAQPDDAAPRFAWISLWLLCFMGIAISAFGQGWLLRLVPERAMIFLALPFAVLAAKGIQEWKIRRPRLALTLLALMLACGTTAVAVSSACFQGPLGHRPGKGPYGYAHCELIGENDAALMRNVGEGVVLTPLTYGPSFGDVFAVRPGNSVVYGFGSMNLGDRPPADARRDVETFFTQGCPDPSRKDIAERWSAAYVYCPDSNPVSEAAREELRNTPWLKETASNGKGVLFRVELPSTP